MCILVFMWVTNNWSGCCLGFRLCYLPLDLFSLAGLPCLGSVRENALIPDATWYATWVILKWSSGTHNRKVGPYPCHVSVQTRWYMINPCGLKREGECSTEEWTTAMAVSSWPWANSTVYIQKRKQLSQQQIHNTQWLSLLSLCCLEHRSKDLLVVGIPSTWKTVRHSALGLCLHLTFHCQLPGQFNRFIAYCCQPGHMPPS